MLAGHPYGHSSVNPIGPSHESRPDRILSLPKRDDERGASPHQLFHQARIARSAAVAKPVDIPNVCLGYQQG